MACLHTTCLHKKKGMSQHLMLSEFNKQRVSLSWIATPATTSLPFPVKSIKRLEKQFFSYTTFVTVTYVLTCCGVKDTTSAVPTRTRPSCWTPVPRLVARQRRLSPASPSLYIVQGLRTALHDIGTRRLCWRAHWVYCILFFVCLHVFYLFFRLWPWGLVILSLRVLGLWTQDFESGSLRVLFCINIFIFLRSLRSIFYVI